MDALLKDVWNPAMYVGKSPHEWQQILRPKKKFNSSKIKVKFLHV
jgi:hypothetical protein